MTEPQPTSKKEARAQAAAAKAYAKSQRSWFSRHKILTALGALILLIVAASALGGGSGTEDTVATDDAPAATAAPSSAPSAAAPAAPAEAAPAVLLQTSGNGIKSTDEFTAEDEWDLAYTYDCSAFGQDGNMQVYVNDSEGNLTSVAVNELGASGGDRTRQQKGGTYSLQVNSTCAWTLTVTG